MVGARGRDKASASRSKRKSLSTVSDMPESVDAEETLGGSSDGEENYNVTLNTDEKEKDDASCGLLADNGLEEKQQFADEENVEEKNAMNESNANQVDSFALSVETEEELEEENEEGDADMESEDNEANSEEENVEEDKVDTEEEYVEENNEVNAEEQNLGEVNGGGDIANNNDVEANEGKSNEEVSAEDEKPLGDSSGNKDEYAAEENKGAEVAAEGMMVNNEGLTASEQDEKMKNVGESNELNAVVPLDTHADNINMTNDREDVNNSNNDKASSQNADKPKRKVVKKKLVRKKIVRKRDVVSGNEANPQSSIGNDSPGNANLVEINKHENNEGKAAGEQPVNVNKKLISKRKKDASESHAGITATSEVQKSEPSNEELGNEVDNKTDKAEVKGEQAGNSGLNKNRKKKKKQKVKKDDTGNGVTANTNKAGPSRKGKSSKKVDTMGMIFMCSSETKKDCYRYKVLGLPAGKKDFVLKIYKGMRLFLFDVELKMLYGIYKAAAPGGLNIEPRAFKSQFPAQVRFTVLEECVPLAEEKFKKVIKENYYTKNKFNFQLTSEQVRKLCKLFSETTKKADSKRFARKPIQAPLPSARRERKRKRPEESRKAAPVSSSKRGRRRPAEEEVRRAPVVIDDRYYQRPVVLEREAYLPPTAPVVVYQPLPPPSPPRSASYSYGRPSRVDVYRRDSDADRRELGLSSLRRPIETDRREPYASYRDSRAYLEPVYETGVRRDLYESSARRDLYEPSARRDLYEPSARQEHYNYTSDSRRGDYYRAEYRAPLPPYRRY